MECDDKFVERENLLQKYESIKKERKSIVSIVSIVFNPKLRRGYRELDRYHERYERISLKGAEMPYLIAANRAFSRKLSDFEKLIGGRNE